MNSSPSSEDELNLNIRRENQCITVIVLCYLDRHPVGRDLSKKPQNRLAFSADYGCSDVHRSSLTFLSCPGWEKRCASKEMRCCSIR